MAAIVLAGFMAYSLTLPGRLQRRIELLADLRMVTEDDVRRIALGLPETSERTYNRLPGFQVRKQLFIRIHELDDALLVSCADLEERNELLAAEPGKFFITPHYEGYPAVLVRLGEVDRDELTELITQSWRLNAPKRLLAAFDKEHPAVS